MTAEAFEQYRTNTKNVLGYMPIKNSCVTCQTPDVNIPKDSKLPNRKCLIRQCVDKAGMANCAYCSTFPCDTLKATAAAWNRENIDAKLGTKLSEEQYYLFVAPFEGIKHLEAIRASLKPDELIEPTKTLTPQKVLVEFPTTLPFSNEAAASFKAVHSLLSAIAVSSLGFSCIDTFAQQHKLENLRAHVLRFLWIFGSYSKLENTQIQTLVVDAETYLANRGSEKTLAIWSFVEGTVFKVLNEFGVSCERVAVKGAKLEELTTGTGYLRNKGWLMRLSFKEEIGGAATLQAFQTYTKRLYSEYGKKAFKHFSNADILTGIN
jgi:hypothetical protein